MSIASELNNYRNGLEDAYDAVSDMSGTIPTDRNMVNLDDAIRTIPVSSPNDGVLTITQNGTAIQTFSANQATNVTAALTDTTYSDFTGATSSVAGAAGLVPAPTTADVDKFLKGDGTWEAAGAATLYTLSSLTPGSFPNGLLTDSNNNRVSAHDIFSRLNSGQSIFLKYPSSDKTFVVTSSRLTSTEDIYIEFSSPITDNKAYRAFILADNHWSGADTDELESADETYSDFTGATSSTAGAHGLVPAPAAGDEGKALHGDGTWKDTTAKLVEMSYGESNAWAKFIAAYNAGSIVYCRASSNANPGTGSQTRKAFMAYVNNAESPTNVEFQYVRSVSSKTDSQQCDQVFVYTLTNASGGTWSVASRNMAPKINVDSTLTKTFSNGANATVTLKANAMTGATGSAAGTAGYVPAPAAGDQNKVLTGAGTWVSPINLNYSYSEQDTGLTWLQGQKIYSFTYYFQSLADHGVVTQPLPSGYVATVKVEAIMRQGANVWPIPYNACWIDVDGTNLEVASPDYDFTGMEAIVTLYYVKTS